MYHHHAHTHFLLLLLLLFFPSFVHAEGGELAADLPDTPLAKVLLWILVIFLVLLSGRCLCVCVCVFVKSSTQKIKQWSMCVSICV
jgi:hypothetical protein